MDWLISHLSQVIAGVALAASAIFAYTDVLTTNALQDQKIATMQETIIDLKRDTIRAIDALTYEVRELRKQQEK